MDTCNICVEKYTKSTRAKITCAKCQDSCCKVCFKRHVSELGSPHVFRCMFCGEEFNRTSLHAALGNAYMNSTFRDIRKEILFEREQGFFAATQDIVEARIKARALRDKISSLGDKYKRAKDAKIREMMQFRGSAEMMPVMGALDRYLILENEIESMHEIEAEEVDSLMARIDKLVNDTKPKRNTYMMVCSSHECNGMLSRENCTQKGNYICILCKRITCQACKMEISEEAHVCDPNILATLQFVEKDAKPCPSCHILIHKISGCNQMFCTQCHASFDWRTMRLNNGAIHNPHHARWLMETRDRPRETGDIQCGRELNVQVIARSIYDRINGSGDASPERDIIRDFIVEAIRMCVHHQEITIPRYSRDRYGHETNQELRIHLLMGDISTDEFKKEIQRRDKCNSKRAEMLHIITAYRDALTDIIWTYYEKSCTLDDWKALNREIDALVEYINACLLDLARVYGSRASRERDILSMY